MRLFPVVMTGYAHGGPQQEALTGGMGIDRCRTILALYAGLALAAAGAPSHAQPAPASPNSRQTAAAALAQPPRQIGVGETLRGELAAGDPRSPNGSYFDLYAFQAVAGQSYVVALTSDEFDTYLYVTGPGGLVAENDDADAGVTNSRLAFTAPQTGEIQIRTNSLARRESGGYSVSLQAGVASRRIALSQSLQGEITAASPKQTDGTPYQAFVFEGQAGQSVTIDLSSRDFDPFLVLRKGGASEDLVSDDDGGGGADAQILFTLPSAGAYEIRANAISTSARGRFTLKLAKGLAARKPTPTQITYGRVVRGELNTSAGRDAGGLFYDVYAFTGQKGDKVTISAASDDFDPVLDLGLAGHVDEDSWLDTNDDGAGGGTDALIQYVLPQDGAYEVHLVSYTPGEAGHYILGLSVAR